MILEKIPYILVVMFLLLENMIVGNFTACRERSISRVTLSERVKKILFPFFYIKRVTYFMLLCQVLSCILFVIALGSLLIINDSFQSVFQLYWNFEKYYIFCVPLFVGGRLYLINLFTLLKLDHYGTDMLRHLFQDMKGEIYKLNDNEIIVVKPVNINGCVFIMLENIIQCMTDICYQDIFYKLLDMNYMLVCIDEYPSKSLEKYKMTIKKIIQFFHLSETSFFYIGSEMYSIYETLRMDYVFKSKGIIWLCELKKEKIMKDLKRILETYRCEEILPMESDICVINVYRKDAEKNLKDWIKEREN